jgi:hypothetical protein
MPIQEFATAEKPHPGKKKTKTLLNDDAYPQKAIVQVT